MLGGTIQWYDPKSASKLRSALHQRYSIDIDAGLGILSIYIFCSAFAKLLFLHIYRTPICSVPLIAVDIIDTVYEI